MWLKWIVAKLQALRNRMTRIVVLVPSPFSWQTVQHCFLRFLTLSILENHLFTMASIPRSASDRHSRISSDTKMSFFVRSHAGFTYKLLCYTSDNLDRPTDLWTDGPYGAVARRFENEYDIIMLVAGGSSITSCM